MLREAPRGTFLGMRASIDSRGPSQLCTALPWGGGSKGRLGGCFGAS